MIDVLLWTTYLLVGRAANLIDLTERLSTFSQHHHCLDSLIKEADWVTSRKEESEFEVATMEEELKLIIGAYLELNSKTCPKECLIAFLEARSLSLLI